MSHQGRPTMIDAARVSLEMLGLLARAVVAGVAVSAVSVLVIVGFVTLAA